jgi:hypothetical protein
MFGVQLSYLSTAIAILTKYIFLLFAFSQMRKATHFVVLGHKCSVEMNADFI